MPLDNPSGYNPSEANPAQTKENLAQLLAPEAAGQIIEAAEGKKIGKEIWEVLAKSRVKRGDETATNFVRGARKQVKDNLTPRLLPTAIPKEYLSFVHTYPVQLAMACCDNTEAFEKFVHICAVSLANAEKIAKPQLDPIDREAREEYPAIGKRIKPGEAGYQAQVWRKCQILEVLSKRYPITEAEGERCLLRILKVAAGVDVTGDERAAKALREQVAPKPSKPLVSPTRKPSAPPFSLFKLQQEAFEGTEVFEGALPYLQRSATRGTPKEVFGVVLPTGVGKTLVAAELAAKLYQKAIAEAAGNRKKGLADEFSEDPPAILFIAPQRVLVTQAARSFHGFLTDQYGIQMDSRLIIGGKAKETKWAFIPKALESYKQTVVEHQDNLIIPPRGPLAGMSSPEVADLLLSHWEEVMELKGDYYELTDWDRETHGGEVLDPTQLLVRDLRRVARKNGIIDDHAIQEEFSRSVLSKLRGLGEKVSQGSSQRIKGWEAIKTAYLVAQEADEAEAVAMGEAGGRRIFSAEELSTTVVANRIAARAGDILSPFKIVDGDNELTALRGIVKRLNIDLPRMYQDLFALTMDCQVGMIQKPDAQAYTFNHLDATEAGVRQEKPLVAAFSTIQAFYNPERLEQVMTYLSNNGQRRVIVMFDEAHHIGADALQNAQVFTRLRHHPQVRTMIGMTASEVRAGGRSITDYFERTAYRASLLQAVATGRLQMFTLVQPAPELAKLSKVQVEQLSSKKAEKSQQRLAAEVADLVNRIELIEKVRRGEIGAEQAFPELPEEDRALWENGLGEYWSRQILGFCNDIPSAQYVVQRLNEQGIKAANIFGDTPVDERNRILEAYRRGEMNSIILVGVGREGLDLPQTTVGVFFGSVGSPVTLQQMFGRCLRLRKGPPTLVLDYSVEASQAYHAELLKREFAVDVVGAPPKGAEPEREPEPAALRKAEGAPTEGVDLLATIDVSAEEIKFSRTEVYTVRDINLVKAEVVAEEKVGVAAPELAKRVEELEAQLEAATKAGEEEPDLPLAKATVDIQCPPLIERLAPIFARGMPLSTVVTGGRVGESWKLGTMTMIPVEGRGIEIKLELTLPDGLELAKPAAVAKRLERARSGRITAGETDLGDWLIAFSSSETSAGARGRGMIDFPFIGMEGEEKRAEISVEFKGRTISLRTTTINASAYVQNAIQDQFAKTIALFAESVVAEETDLAFNIDLAKKAEEMLAERRIRFSVPADAAKQIMVEMRQTPWVYNWKERERLKAEEKDYWNNKSREVHYEGLAAIRDGQGYLNYDLNIEYSQDYPKEGEPIRQNFRNISFSAGLYSPDLDYWQMDPSLCTEKVLDLLRLMGLKMRWKNEYISQDRSHYALTLHNIEIVELDQETKMKQTLFLCKETIINIDAAKVQMYKSKRELRGKPGLEVRITTFDPINIDRSTQEFTETEVNKYLETVHEMVELFLSGMVEMFNYKNELDLKDSQIELIRNKYHQGKDYQIE